MAKWHCGSRSCKGEHDSPGDVCKEGRWFCNAAKPKSSKCAGRHSDKKHRCDPQNKPDGVIYWTCGSNNCPTHENYWDVCPEDPKRHWKCNRHDPLCEKHRKKKDVCRNVELPAGEDPVCSSEDDLWEEGETVWQDDETSGVNDESVCDPYTHTCPDGKETAMFCDEDDYFNAYVPCGPETSVVVVSLKWWQTEMKREKALLSIEEIYEDKPKDIVLHFARWAVKNWDGMMVMAGKTALTKDFWNPGLVIAKLNSESEVPEKVFERMAKKYMQQVRGVMQNTQGNIGHHFKNPDNRKYLGTLYAIDKKFGLPDKDIENYEAWEFTASPNSKQALDTRVKIMDGLGYQFFTYTITNSTEVISLETGQELEKPYYETLTHYIFTGENSIQELRRQRSRQ